MKYTEFSRYRLKLVKSSAFKAFVDVIAKDKNISYKNTKFCYDDKGNLHITMENNSSNIYRTLDYKFDFGEHTFRVVVTHNCDVDDKDIAILAKLLADFVVNADDESKKENHNIGNLVALLLLAFAMATTLFIAQFFNTCKVICLWELL